MVIIMKAKESIVNYYNKNRVFKKKNLKEICFLKSDLLFTV